MTKKCCPLCEIYLDYKEPREGSTVYQCRDRNCKCHKEAPQEECKHEEVAMNDSYTESICLKCGKNFKATPPTRDRGTCRNCTPIIKDHLATQLKELREKIGRVSNFAEIREMEGAQYAQGHQKAIDDILALLSPSDKPRIG